METAPWRRRTSGVDELWHGHRCRAQHIHQQCHWHNLHFSSPCFEQILLRRDQEHSGTHHNLCMAGEQTWMCRKFPWAQNQPLTRIITTFVGIQLCRLQHVQMKSCIAKRHFSVQKTHCTESLDDHGEKNPSWVSFASTSRRPPWGRKCHSPTHVQCSKLQHVQSSP